MPETDSNYGEVICDDANNIYVASCTMSSDFPTTTNAFQTSYGGVQDGCIFKLNADASALVYSTFIGGDNADACYSMALKFDNSLYATGGTMSLDFPSAGNGVNNAYLGGTMDGFVLRLNSNGTILLSSSFLGTAEEDQGYIVKLDIDENVYVLGQTTGNYPIIAPPTATDIYNNPNSGQFITKLNPQLNAIIYSTVFGNGNGQTNLSPTAFLVDTCFNVYVCGWGGDLIGGVGLNPNEMFNMPITDDALQPTTDGADFYLIVFNQDIDTIAYATYFGGSGTGEHVDGGTSRFDPKGVVYEAVCASCGQLQPTDPPPFQGTPVTPGVVSETNNSGNCNELGFKMDLGLFAVEAIAQADPAATGCAPLNVNFINNSINSTSFFWNFGTGDPSDTSNAFEPNFTYTDTGTYPVMLIAYSPTACVPYDTAFTSVVVYNTIATATFENVLTDMCDSLVAQFTSGANGPNAQYFWTFGDDSTSTEANPIHVYYALDTYTVTLLVIDTTACNQLDTFITEFIFDSRVETNMNDETIEGCAPVLVQRTSNSINAVTWEWTFSDSLPTTETTISRTYTNPGTYTITYVAANDGKCNLTDTTVISITVYPTAATAAFTMTSASNDPQTYAFTNESTNATSYIWDFGDGSTSSETNPIHHFALGGYDVCLTAVNGPCPGITCQRVEVAFKPVIDVPNAFSPNEDGSNDFLFVEGLGVKTMLFRVFNRWGEKVFETNDIDIGWDGTYKGMPQEMDVFAWTLNAILDGDQKVERSGNVTLIR